MDAVRTATHDPPATAMAGPFRVILATVAIGSLAVQAVDFYSGDFLRGGLVGVIAAIALLVWWISERGAIEPAAVLLFAVITVMVTIRMWLGHGLRDFAVAVYPLVLFLGCIFLRARAYWAVSALVLAGGAVVGIGEALGWRPGPLRASAVANLLIVLAATAVGGRALVHALRGSFARERHLAGALASAEERMHKIFRSSQSAIVVSRLADGRYLDVNESYLRMFGYLRDEVAGRTALELGIWEDPRDRERFVGEVARRGRVDDFDARLCRRSGEPFETRLSAERLALDGDEWLVISVADVSAVKHAQRRAEFLATRDPLTGLPNRSLALDRLQRAIGAAGSAPRRIGVLSVGIDRLSELNATLGRGAGDDVIVEASRRVRAALGERDTLARFGGNELLCIVEDVADRERLASLAAKLAATFHPPFEVAQHSLRLSGSVGACLHPEDGTDAELLASRADAALRAAKAAGRGLVRLFDDAMTERNRTRVLVEARLRESIAGRSGLRLAYQPKIALASWRMTGVEALARWSHPDLGEVSPGRFVPIAEESDLVRELGDWVLDAACLQLARWRGTAAAGLSIAVNLSPRQLESGLAARVEAHARRHGVDPARLDFEVTENVLIANPDAARHVLQELAARGSRIVLDDFGVGYSSLAYLKQLPLEGVKIDRSFVADIASDRHDAAIVSAIIGLAHGLGIRVIAEGVERVEQLDALRAAGCDEVQGFLVGTPATPEDVAARLAAPQRPADTAPTPAAMPAP